MGGLVSRRKWKNISKEHENVVYVRRRDYSLLSESSVADSIDLGIEDKSKKTIQDSQNLQCQENKEEKVQDEKKSNSHYLPKGSKDASMDKSSAGTADVSPQIPKRAVTEKRVA